MIPSPRLFRSRWAALLWAGGILWAAAHIARSAPHEGAQQARSPDADQAELNAADLDALSNMLDR